MIKESQRYILHLAIALYITSYQCYATQTVPGMYNFLLSTVHKILMYSQHSLRWSIAIFIIHDVMDGIEGGADKSGGGARTPLCTTFSLFLP